MSLFGSLFNVGAGFAIQSLLNSMISEFGMLKDLRITSNEGKRTKDLILVVELKGETEAIQVFITGAKLVRRSSDHYLCLETISTPSTTKVWVNLLLEKFKIVPMEISISGSVASQLRLFLHEEDQSVSMDLPKPLVPTPIGNQT